MIHIKNAKRTDVIAALETETNFLIGLKDNIVMLRDISGTAGDDVKKAIETNATLKSIVSGLRREIHNADLLTALQYAIENLQVWGARLKEIITKSDTKVWDDSTITFRERGVLDAISSINFFNRYADTVLNVLLTAAYDGADPKTIMSKVDLSFFSDTAAYFTTLVVRFNQPAKELWKMIEDLSDELVDDLSADILRGTDGEASVSIRKGLAPHQLNPLHWVYVWRMKRDLETIRSGNEQIELLALKIARLNNKNSGVQDPNLDHQIEVYTDKIIKIKARNNKIVESYRE